MTALKVYLVRHGETDTNRQDKKWGQHPDTPLNDLGIEQAKRLSDKLKGIKFNKIFSSDLGRAAQTVEILMQKIKAPLIMDKRLREYDPGEVDQSSDKWRKRYYELLESGMQKEEIRPYGGENIWDLIKRVKSLIKDLEKEEGTILLVTHSGFNEAFINLSQLREKGDFVKIKQDNTCINLLEYVEGKWIIKKINDSDHISEFFPETKIYDNQQEIKEEAKKYILKNLYDSCKKIIITGDIVESKMGYYDRPHKRHKGSTIEIFAEFKDGFKIPSDWKISEINDNFQRYEIGFMEIKGLKHKFNVTTPISTLNKNSYEVIKEETKTIAGVSIAYYSMKILKEPIGKEKGAIILSQVDKVLEKMPFVKDKFYIIERRAWRGMNESKYADIKLVEDLSFWDETVKTFPDCICLDIGPADFVDTDKFKPIKIKKEYAGIQISQWAEFKRSELMIKAAALIPKRKFLKLGHFMEGGLEYEKVYRDSLIKLSKDIGANIDFPLSNAKSNKDFPQSKEETNKEINKAYLGILTTKIEGINRFKMECLTANIPVLVSKDACYPTKKHINKMTGAFFEPTPEGLASTIENVLKNIDKYRPRDYLLQNTGKKKSLAKLKKALKTLCLRDGVADRFQDIDWDGRNQSLIWGEHVFEELEKYSK